MRHRLSVLTILAAVLSVGALATTPSPVSAAPLVGIADQKPDMFDDGRFRALGLRTARYYVPYDIDKHEFQLTRLDAWMASARTQGVAPLITMERAISTATRRRGAPTVAAYRKAVRFLRARYPFVKAYSVWNESNHSGQPLRTKPRLAVSYYKVLQTECRGCKILASDLLDDKNMVAWARQFERALGKGKTAPIWGLHSYSDANNFRMAEITKLLGAVKGKIWLTEVGGVVQRRSRFSRARFRGTGEAHAAKATAYLLDKIARLSPRIERMYLYHWNSSTPTDSWDSAFVGADGRARTSLAVLRNRLTSSGRVRSRGKAPKPFKAPKAKPGKPGRAR